MSADIGDWAWKINQDTGLVYEQLMVADLSPFGLDNPNEVFIAGDRPYGLIEAQVARDDDIIGPGQAWESIPGFI